MVEHNRRNISLRTSVISRCITREVEETRSRPDPMTTSRTNSSVRNHLCSSS